MKKDKKVYKLQPSLNGTMQCIKGHKWDVRNLNPERQSVTCPVCGILNSIHQRLIKQ
jgi:hypothetical protein